MGSDLPWIIFHKLDLFGGISSTGFHNLLVFQAYTEQPGFNLEWRNQIAQRKHTQRLLRMKMKKIFHLMPVEKLIWIKFDNLHLWSLRFSTQLPKLIILIITLIDSFLFFIKFPSSVRCKYCTNPVIVNYFALLSVTVLGILLPISKFSPKSIVLKQLFFFILQISFFQRNPVLIRRSRTKSCTRNLLNSNHLTEMSWHILQVMATVFILKSWIFAADPVVENP